MTLRDINRISADRRPQSDQRPANEEDGSVAPAEDGKAEIVSGAHNEVRLLKNWRHGSSF